MEIHFHKKFKDVKEKTPFQTSPQFIFFSSTLDSDSNRSRTRWEIEIPNSKYITYWEIDHLEQNCWANKPLKNIVIQSSQASFNSSWIFIASLVCLLSRLTFKWLLIVNLTVEILKAWQTKWPTKRLTWTNTEAFLIIDLKMRECLRKMGKILISEVKHSRSFKIFVLLMVPGL